MCDIFDIIKLSRMINNAKFPILVIGNEFNNNDTLTYILDFAYKNNINFFITQYAEFMINQTNPLFKGILNISENNGFQEIFNKSDMLIIAGVYSEEIISNIKESFNNGKIIYLKNDINNDTCIDVEKSYFIGNIKYIIKNLNPLVNRSIFRPVAV